jgi:hypothetical protein
VPPPLGHCRAPAQAVQRWRTGRQRAGCTAGSLRCRSRGMLRSTAPRTPEPENCSLTGRSSRPAPAGGVSPVRGTRCIIAYRAYAACLHRSAQLNVRRRNCHQSRNLAAVNQVRRPSVLFGAAAATRRARAGEVCRVAKAELTVQRRAASPVPLCGRRQKTSVKVSVAGVCSLRQRLVEHRSTTLRVAQPLGRCRTGRVRPVRVVVARFAQQNQGMSLPSVFRLAYVAPAVCAGSWTSCAPRKAAPNWALEPTRSGRQRKPGPRYLRHLRVPGLRCLPPRVGSALR